MVKNVPGPRDSLVQGHVLRAQSGQVIGTQDEADVTDVTFYDAYQAGLEAGNPTVDLGEADATGAISKARTNPLTSADEPSAFASEDDPATEWRADIKVIAGNVYVDEEGEKFVARQSHDAQADRKPKDVLSLFTKVPKNVLVWEANVDLTKSPGIVVYYPEKGGPRYELLQPHVTQVGWEPPKVPALWRLVEEPVRAAGPVKLSR